MPEQLVILKVDAVTEAAAVRYALHLLELAEPDRASEWCGRVFPFSRYERPVPTTRFGFGAYVLDTAARAVFEGERRVPLTAGEYALLAVLVTRQPGKVWSRAELLLAVSGRVSVAKPDRTIDVMVQRLRAKLAFDNIRAVRSAGYALAPGVTPL